MGNKYVKRDETFDVNQNGVVPKPTQSEIDSGKFLKANGQWGSGGGSGGSSTFAGLDDVSISNLQNGQIPKYNSTTQKWENSNESGGGGTVADVEVDGVSVVNQQGVAKITTPDADDIDYDNQQSGLSATDVQSALDELAQNSGKVKDVEVNGVSVLDAQNVAKIKSYKEVTQSEYNALPASKLTDNVMYCIKDAGGADAFPPLIFSDEEREIGIWRDGRPLYQKTIDCGYLPNNDISLVQTGLTNIVAIHAFGHCLNSFQNIFIPNASAAGVQWGIGIHLEDNGATLKVRTGEDRSSFYAYVTLRYYKTTDTPGSGTWNQQGSYAHHYSTTEHIIGTWIDGKPLYEKVLIPTETVSLIENTWVKTEYDKGNIKSIKNLIIGNDTYGSLHVGLSGAFVDDKLAINSFRNVSYTFGDSIYIILQYTKTTD